MAEQDAVLDGASGYVKPGGRLVYVTCSVLPEENEDRITDFLARTNGFQPVPALDVMEATGQLADGARTVLEACTGAHGALQLSPARTDTDGFYICVMERRG
jgi:16S rRNA (cytosine967-C5)-methyltransferase